MSGIEPRGTITTVHRYALPLPRAEVWALIGQVSQYRSWWPWLRAFEAVVLAPGEEWRCEVQPPVPYPVRFRVAIGRVVEGSLVEAEVLGDVVGRATLTLEDAVRGGDAADAVAAMGSIGPMDANGRTGSNGSGPYGGGPGSGSEAMSVAVGTSEGNPGCVAILRSALAPGNAVLQQVSRFAAPVARFGHDWVLDSGARQFLARAVAPVAGD